MAELKPPGPAVRLPAVEPVLHDSQVVAELKLQPHDLGQLLVGRVLHDSQVVAELKPAAGGPAATCCGVLHDSQVVAELKPLVRRRRLTRLARVLHDSQVVAELKRPRPVLRHRRGREFSTTHRSWPN